MCIASGARGAFHPLALTPLTLLVNKHVIFEQLNDIGQSHAKSRSQLDMPCEQRPKAIR
jgi:hypothetical protein